MDKILCDCSIMVVDDTTANLDLLDDILSKKYEKIRLFTDGNFAFKSALSDPPDIILLDVMMPQIDGYELGLKIKANRVLSDIPIIFISAKSETLDKVKAFQSGGVDYITKPFHIPEVMARVETHLRLGKYRAELEEKNNKLNETLKSLKEAQSQLIQAKTLSSLGTLTAGIAHEINNPVNAINSSGIALGKIIRKFLALIEIYDKLRTENTDSILEEAAIFKKEISYSEITEGVEQLLRNIDVASNRTIEIVRSLKTFTHMGRNEKEAIDIHENIESTLILLNQRIKDRIRVTKHFGNIPKVKCFPGKINQVFVNILANAVDALENKIIIGEPAEIEIKTSLAADQEKPSVNIEFSDSGAGVPEDIKEKIFDPFFTTKDVGQGTGLGLSISYGIIKSHGGNISIGTNRVGGAVFILNLPIE